MIVTGGAGFIGSHRVDRLIALRHRVTVIDGPVTGFRGNLNPKARFYGDDIRNTTRIREIFRRERPEFDRSAPPAPRGWPGGSGSFLSDSFPERPRGNRRAIPGGS